jgi:flagellar biosynthetic protein FliR
VTPPAQSLLVFARCAGFVSRAPGFSHPSVPHAARAGLALALTVAMIPAIRAARTFDGAGFALAAAAEFGVGAAIGFAASILYDGAYAGGRALDDYAGVRGSVPGAQIYAASAFGRIWSLVFTAGYFLLGGYRLLLPAFAQSFDRVPLGVWPSSGGLYRFAVALPASIVEAALLVAAPAMALIFVGQITLGALTRVVPRFASFTLSFPIVFGLALIATIAAVPLLFSASATPWFRVPFLEQR